MTRPFGDLTPAGQQRRLARLAADALAAYDLRVAGVRVHASGTNLLYRVLTDAGERLILRMAVPGWRTLADLQAEAAWLEALSRDTDIGDAGEVVLMRFVGDEHGPAPRLADLRLAPEDARRAFDGAVRGLVGLWRAGVVHGDYSTYNLLWWRDEVVVIDLPQAVEADHREARSLLARDAASLCTTFRHHGVEARPETVLRSVTSGSRA